MRCSTFIVAMRRSMPSAPLAVKAISNASNAPATAARRESVRPTAIRVPITATNAMSLTRHLMDTVPLISFDYLLIMLLRGRPSAVYAFAYGLVLILFSSARASAMCDVPLLHSASVEGKAYYAGEAVPGMPISLVGNASDLETTTDTSGHFVFPAVAAGNYKIFVGFAEKSAEPFLVCVSDHATFLQLESPLVESSCCRVIACDPPGEPCELTDFEVKGLVFDEQHVPIVGARVTLPSGVLVVSDSSGAFTLLSPHGNGLRVQVDAPGYQAWSIVIPCDTVAIRISLVPICTNSRATRPRSS